VPKLLIVAIVMGIVVMVGSVVSVYGLYRIRNPKS